MRRAAAYVVGVVALAAAAPSACRGSRSEGQGPPPQATAPLAVGTAVTTSAVVPKTLTSTGTLVGATQADVAPLTSGRVTKMFVEIGDRVKEGDPILQLRTDDHRNQVAAARAALAQAEARAGGGPDGGAAEQPEVVSARATLEAAERDLSRDERLFASGSIGRAALDQTRTRVETARAQLEAAESGARANTSAVQAAQAQLALAERGLADTTLRAPFAGEIASRSVSAGDYVSPQTPAVRLVEVDELRVRLSIPQEQVPLVHVGQAVTFRVDARPNQTFTGTVKYVSAAVDPKSRMLEVEAEIPNPDGALRPGYFVHAEIALAGTETLTRVPAKAVVPHGDSDSVFVVENERAAERVVDVARRDEGAVLLSSGVRPGEPVVVEHVDGLIDGAPVQPSPADAAAPPPAAAH